MENIFFDAPFLMNKYGENISTGAIGVFSYLKRLEVGIKQLMALNRKFSLDYIDRTDLIPLTREAKELLNQLDRN